MSDGLELKSVLSLDVSPFELGLITALKSAANFADKLVSTFESGVSDSLQRVSKQFSQSSSFDITVAQLQKLQFAASQTSTPLGQLEMAMRRMEQLSGDATFGNKKALDVLKTLKIDATALANTPLPDQLGVIWQQLKQVGDVAQRTSLEMKIFGRSGSELNKMLEGMDRASETFERLGLGTSQLDSAKIQIAKESLGEIDSIWQSIYNTIAGKVAPIISNVITKFEKMGFTGTNMKTQIDNAFKSLREFSISAVAIGMAFGDMWPKIWENISNVFQNTTAALGSLSKDLGNFILWIEPALTAVSKTFENIFFSYDIAEMKREIKIKQEVADKFRNNANNPPEYKELERLGYDLKNGGRNDYIETNRRMAADVDKQISRLSDELSYKLDKKIERDTGQSALEQFGHELADGTFIKDTGDSIKGTFKKILDDSEKYHKEATKIVDSYYQGSAELKAIRRLDDKIQPPMDKSLIASMAAPIGYAINATNTAYDIGAMHLSGTNIQPVTDEGVIKAIKELPEELGHALGDGTLE